MRDTSVTAYCMPRQAVPATSPSQLTFTNPCHKVHVCTAPKKSLYGETLALWAGLSGFERRARGHALALYLAVASGIGALMIIPWRCVVCTQLNPPPVHGHTDHACLRRKLSTDLQTRRRHSADTSRALIVLLTTRFNTTTAVSDDVNKILLFLVRFCIGQEPLALILSSYLID